jgi:hypothetical protein
MSGLPDAGWLVALLSGTGPAGLGEAHVCLAPQVRAEPSHLAVAA